MKHCAEALAKEPDLADTYMLHSLQQVMLALRTAEADPSGTGTRQLAAEAMQVGTFVSPQAPDLASAQPEIHACIMLPGVQLTSCRSIHEHRVCLGQ